MEDGDSSDPKSQLVLMDAKLLFKDECDILEIYIDAS